jgi:hypothetical protein
MNINECKAVVKEILVYNLSNNDAKDYGRNIIPLLVSKPGLGKTSVVEQIAEEEGYHLFTIPLASYDAGEIAGFPMLDKENKVYNRARPFWLDTPLDGVVMLFFDEISQAPTANINVLAMLINERKLGEHKLNDNVVIVCAGNKMEHRAGTNPLPSHFKDRVTFLDVQEDLTEFLAYGNSKGLHQYIVAYLRNRPSSLSTFDPAVDSCASPRGWMRVDSIMKMNLPYNLRNETIKGQVGDAIKADFLAYLKVADEMPDPNEVLAGTNKTIPDKSPVMYALCAGLAHLVTGKTSKNFIEYLSSLPNKEFAAFTIRDALQRNPKLKADKHITSWFMSEGKALLL